MKNYRLERTTFLPVPVDVAWRFFSDPRNLEKITPPALGFRILTTTLPGSIHEGLTIRYTVIPLAALRVNWVSEITDVRPPYRFTDIQRRGPYAWWKHTHRFGPAPGGTSMDDEVEYRLPFGPLGRIVHAVAVKKKLNDIFDYRAKAIQKLFAPGQTVMT